ncbi:MAG TPA: IS21-like element helper ATPase IstB [Niabella sp.]|nr:IS21-like element helper ATPase IstB [Niabella sp.]
MKNMTVEAMNAMKFSGMVEAFQASLQTRQSEKFTPDEFINYLIQAEWDHRQNRKVNLAIRRARFRYQAIVEDIDFTSGRGLDKNQILRLSDCSFIEKNECVLIAGATGVGKSHLASALGHQACVKGYKVLYFNTAKLFSKLRMSKADASYTREINKLAKQDLLILDDFGLHPLDAPTRLMLLEIIEDRHGRKSTIIASQVPIPKWYDILEEETIADAILDRLIHHAHRIELKGESMRKKAKK